MPKITKLDLSADQIKELTTARDRHPKAYVREKAAALLKVNQGQSIRQVALHGLHKRRSEHTVKSWLSRYRADGLTGLGVKAGRGRKAAFFPPQPLRGRTSRGVSVAPVAPPVRDQAKPLAAARCGPGAEVVGRLHRSGHLQSAQTLRL